MKIKIRTKKGDRLKFNGEVITNGHWAFKKEFAKAQFKFIEPCDTLLRNDISFHHEYGQSTLDIKFNAESAFEKVTSNRAIISDIEIKGLIIIVHEKGVVRFQPKYISLLSGCDRFTISEECEMMHGYKEDKPVGVLMCVRNKELHPEIEKAIQKYFWKKS